MGRSELLNKDVILERALLKSVLKPLHAYLYKLFVKHAKWYVLHFCLQKLLASQIVHILHAFLYKLFLKHVKICVEQNIVSIFL